MQRRGGASEPEPDRADTGIKLRHALARTRECSDASAELHRQVEVALSEGARRVKDARLARVIDDVRLTVQVLKVRTEDGVGALGIAVPPQALHIFGERIFQVFEQRV